jgi:hypothetical protein
MMQRIEAMIASLFWAPSSMPQSELEERVHVLEAKIESNEEALSRHEARPHPRERSLDQR